MNNQQLREGIDELLRSGLEEHRQSPQPDATILKVGTLDVDDWQIVVVVARKCNHRLTSRERAIAALVGHGLGDRGIATKLGLRPSTVSNHLQHIYRKLNISSRAALARYSAVFLAGTFE